MLIRDGQTFLGVIVLVFSIIFPIVKLTYLLVASTLPAAELRRHAKRLKAIEWIGKWSMHDVLVLALMIFFLKSQGFYDAASLPAVYLFTAAVALMILSYAWLKTDVAAAGGMALERELPKPLSAVRNVSSELPHHPGDGVLRARHHPAGDPLHHHLCVDQRALDRDHHLRALREQRVLPVRGGVRRLDLLSVPEAVLSA